MTDKPAPSFDTKRFLEFCRSKPRDEEYNRYDQQACAFAQFGLKGVGSGQAEEFGISEEVYALVVYSSRGPATFGALADRLERLVQ